MSLTTKILIGMGLGILAGIFFGEKAADIQVLGDAFVQLLQMSVIPFVTVSLIAGLGRLTYGEALSLAKKCGAILLVLWAIALVMVCLIPMAFPSWEAASFFTPSLVEEREEVDFLKMYIPANPFYSLANTIVPAVVVFSILMGVALIGIERKHGFLETLSLLLDMLARVTGFVVQLAPIGVFAIAASAAGTIHPEDLGRLEVYLSVYVAVALVLTFWVLPALVSNLTPLSYKEVIVPARSALVTAFATGNHLLVLPLLTERGRQLLRDAELVTEESESVVEVIVPTSYSFPTLGMLLSMSFVPFAGWYVGTELSFAQYPPFLMSGLVTYFSGPYIAMPFLLDVVRIPADMFKLFVTVDVLTGRFGALVAAMHMWVLALLGSCAMVGRVTVRWKKLLPSVAASVLLCVVAVTGVGAVFTYAISHEYTTYRNFVEMELLEKPVSAKVHAKRPATLPAHDLQRSRLDVIRERGSMRVCYRPDGLPFVFRNAAGRLVGRDVDLAHGLARYLNVSLDLVPLKEWGQFDNLVDDINSGICDVIIPAFVTTPRRVEKVAFSTSDYDATVAFIVKDHRRDDFTKWETVRSLEAPRIGFAAQSRYYRSWVEELLPRAKIVELDSPRAFFTKQVKGLDAFIFTAEAGSAWTLVYPGYTVAVPLPKPLKVPFGYPLPRGDQKLKTLVSTWIELRKKDGTFAKLFDHWILGKTVGKGRPRWSVIRDVLHWVD